MDFNFSDPNTINAMSMALGMIGQAFAQNPQQMAMAQMGTKLAANQQRSQLLSNLLKGGAPNQSAAPTQPASALGGLTGAPAPTSSITGLSPGEVDQMPNAPGLAPAQPTVGASQLGGLSPVQSNILSMLLGGGQTPFGSTQRR